MQDTVFRLILTNLKAKSQGEKAIILLRGFAFVQTFASNTADSIFFSQISFTSVKTKASFTRPSKSWIGPKLHSEKDFHAWCNITQNFPKYPKLL